MRSIVFILVSLVFTCSVFAQENKQSTYVNGMYIHEGVDVSVFGDLHNVDSTLYNDGHLTMIGDSLINEAKIKGSGTLEMLGDYDQHITHNGIIIVDSLILNNRLDISFDNNIFINEHTAFINGILYDIYDVDVHPDSLPSVTFARNATFDSTQVRDESHIEGLVRKVGHTRFIFPVGDANFYRPAVIDDIPSDTTISVHYYYEWIVYPEEQLQVGVELYRDEYWYISGNETQVDVTLTYDSNTSTFDTDEDGVKIVVYDAELDSRYRLIDAEPVSVVSRLSYVADSVPLDSSFVWYGFARLDPDQETTVELFIPQILSPNGDGRNDKFVIKGIASIEDNRLVIFNRYGDVLYEKENYDNSWDGTANKNVIGGSNAHLVPSGTYYVFLYSGDDLIYKDFVQVIRSN